MSLLALISVPRLGRLVERCGIPWWLDTCTYYSEMSGSSASLKQHCCWPVADFRRDVLMCHLSWRMSHTLSRWWEEHRYSSWPQCEGCMDSLSENGKFLKINGVFHRLKFVVADWVMENLRNLGYWLAHGSPGGSVHPSIPRRRDFRLPWDSSSPVRQQLAGLHRGRIFDHRRWWYGTVEDFVCTWDDWMMHGTLSFYDWPLVTVSWWWCIILWLSFIVIIHSWNDHSIIVIHEYPWANTESL